MMTMILRILQMEIESWISRCADDRCADVQIIDVQITD